MSRRGESSAALLRQRVSASRWFLPGLGGAAALALFLETRIWLLRTFPPFLDESILAWYAELGRDPDQRLISLQQGIRPGLVWLTLAGMRLHFDPISSIRLAALLFSLLGFCCGAVLTWRYAGGVAAAAFTVLALFTPYLFLYDALGLRDPLIAGLMVAGLFAQIELARRPRFVTGVLLGLTFGGDVLIKDSGKVALFLFPLSLVYFPFRSPQRIRLAAAWLLNASVALLICYAATLPLMLSSDYQTLGAAQAVGQVTRSYGAVLAHPLYYFDQSWPGVRGELTAYLTYPVVAVALAGLALGLRRRPRFTALVAVWALVQVASVIWIAGNLDARYLVPSIPFILILAAIGFDELRTLALAASGRLRAARPRRIGAAAALVGLALLVPALVFDAELSYAPASAPYPPDDKAGFITGFAAGEGVSAAVDELKVLANGQELNVLSNPDNAYESFELLAAQRGVDVNWIWTGDPNARTAALLSNGLPPPSGLGRFTVIWSYQRPDGGIPITISTQR